MLDILLEVMYVDYQLFGKGNIVGLYRQIDVCIVLNI